jgi:hypothetical protein
VGTVLVVVGVAATRRESIECGRAILFGAIAVGAFAASLTIPSTSSASPYIRYGVQDDAYLGSGRSLEANLETLDRLGVKLVRFTINWRQVARRKPARAVNPGDPAYEWSRRTRS